MLHIFHVCRLRRRSILDTVRFKQSGATPHTAGHVSDYMNEPGYLAWTAVINPPRSLIWALWTSVCAVMLNRLWSLWSGRAWSNSKSAALGAKLCCIESLAAFGPGLLQS